MNTATDVPAHRNGGAELEARALLMEDLPVSERRAELAGSATVWLEGGQGPPLILLHGPGESGVNWRWVIPELVKDYRVVAPDLPGHGSSGGGGMTWTGSRINEWMDALIEHTCAEPPVVIGHVLGGAIAARFAASRGERIQGLVLVDSLGLAPFRPSLRFAAALIGFQAHPTETTYRWFMEQCAYDLDELQDRMDDRWDSFVSYNLAMAKGPQGKAAGRMLKELGLPRIPEKVLDEIRVPTTLIWGRHDRANRLSLAVGVSERFGWPLHVIEDAADDPARDRPRGFLDALYSTLSPPQDGESPMSDATYEATFASKAAERYEQHFVPTIGRPVASGLLKAAGLRRGERVLDVACGTGIVTRLAAEQVGADGSVEGLDPNPAMLAVARNAVPARASVTWHEAPAERIPLEDGSFDVVLCGMGLQFFTDRAAALREIRRVLAPGGRFVANVPGPIPPPLQAMADQLRKHVGLESAGFVETVFSLHQADELRALAEEAGFGHVDVRSHQIPLELGAPDEFLWSYVLSTPVAAAVTKLDPEQRRLLERDFVADCAPFLKDGKLRGGVRMATVVAA